MTIVANHSATAAHGADDLPPPVVRRSLWQLFFGDLASAALTVITGSLLIAVAPTAVNWAVLDAVWSTHDPRACQEAGACWAFIAAKLRFILFGVYPPGQQWRPLLVIGLMLVAVLITLSPRMWGSRLIVGWCILIVSMLALMWGGFAGMPFVSTAGWGGLPVTLLLAVLSLGLGFPFAVILALGRRSDSLVPRILSLLTIEIVRGLPLVGLLFVASILLPLLLPAGWTIDKLGRTLAALTVFAAAYLAEVIRGGLQGVPAGQVEAAQALGIPRWKSVWHIVLPQAIQKVIPPLTNTAIVMVKNTSLVLIVGVFDMLSAGRAAATDPEWPAPYAETYLFVALMYFLICFGISRYSLFLEQRVREKDYR
ncbi:amino acid ABC transporter permease [Mesorhizobium sp.]|uniref:amino acid ABC transporter permease n=1 Tax=Mesorhizobium sp. TaxID=1871066 RepID=UPI000FE51D85|nr:amino acid ABC transporter permease [Mesorhizobium sp.]RWK40941.1 MAG: amino acid ABC transporter permease [Mesorhizobium sp.]RWK67584.1 MAG: amino acid ABC transporter permease [Mesorhizobium sp.]RWK79155.1 MAG: amino acid ABC transporter permease [Mesorhizobium sp.]RWK84036.1 MAG: amino acid ABC transporter permease [Mesorhizobium sp.]RWL05434.1 MAG: amino acid ABC transporter permease [Mesorhizobium sp.]